MLGLTRSASEAKESGQSGVNKDGNLEMMECCYNSRPNQRCYMKSILWMEKKPMSTLIEEQLAAHCFNIRKMKLFSQFRWINSRYTPDLEYSERRKIKRYACNKLGSWKSLFNISVVKHSKLI